MNEKQLAPSTTEGDVGHYHEAVEITPEQWSGLRRAVAKCLCHYAIEQAQGEPIKHDPRCQRAATIFSDCICDLPGVEVNPSCSIHGDEPHLDSALAALETIRTEKLAAAGLHAEAEAVSRARVALDAAGAKAKP